MDCSPSDDRSFGPRVNTNCRSFDFTLRFEDVFFACLPAALFLVFLPANIAVLLRQPIIFPLRSKLFTTRLVILAGVLTAQCAFLIIRTQEPSSQNQASLAADILSSVAAGSALALSWLSYQRALRPSTLLSLYFLACGSLGVSRTRTLWMMRLDSRVPAAATALVALTFTALLLESFEIKTGFREKIPGTAEQKSGFWSRTCFAWLTSTFRTGYAKVMSIDDLPPLDMQLESHKLHEQLVSSWNKYKCQDHLGLLKACFHAFSSSFSSAILPRLCLTAFTFTQPFLISTTVDFVGQESPNKEYGRGLIGAWTLSLAGLAISSSVYFYQNLRFITRLRGSLIALIYQKTTHTRTVDLGETTAVTLIGTDVERIASGMQMLHEVWASLLDIGIAAWLLGRQLNVACIAPIVLVAAFAGVTFRLSLAANTSQLRWIEKVQQRLRVTSHFLDDVKVVKMLGFSGVMSTVIQKLRMEEIQTSRAYRKLFAAIILLSLTPMNLAPVATFAVYIIISVYWKHESLLTAQAFTSLALISLLATPTVIFIQALPKVIQCINCFDRIQEYCNYDFKPEVSRDANKEQTGSEMDLEPLATKARENQSPIQNGHISFNGHSFAWDRNRPSFLKDLHIEIKQGSINAVVGPVGSGKSSFLECILGEMISTSLEHRGISTSVAYCSQQAWLEHTSIRQNIIGTSPYDGKWYGEVVFSCGLEPDLRQLTKGDQTRVGSKGLNLSGGQRQRIALARAVYARRSVVLLDDVFSGMDAHTSTMVLSCLLGRDGIFRKQDATVILATHSRDVMEIADTIAVFEDGKIVEFGNLQSFLERNDYVSKLGLKAPDRDNTKGVAETAIPSLASKEPYFSDEVGDGLGKPSTDIWRKNGELSVHKYYLTSSGFSAVGSYLLFVALWVFCTEFPTLWVKWWSEANEVHPNTKLGMYMGLFVVIGVMGAICACLAVWFAIISMISNSAARLHLDLLETVTRASFRFFATTDTGELTNRFSQDMELIDMALPLVLINFTSTAFHLIVKVVILLIFSRYLGAAVPPFAIILYLLQRFYLQTSRQVRLLEIEAKAPLFTHFIESVSGAATIRAFGWQSHYQERNCRFIDTSQRLTYLLSCIHYWLDFVLNIIVMLLSVTLVSVVVTWVEKFSAGSVGVSLVMIVGFNSMLARLIQTWTDMESSIGAVTRVKRFVEETELEDHNSTNRDLPLEWPQAGALELSGVVASYKPGADPVLKGISLSVGPRQHIAICGRSGSGKSSLMLCLLRMMDVTNGQITIDGVDIATLACEDLRSRVNVVPQEPFLLPGSLRFNMDPTDSISDEDIIRALERVGLWISIRDRGGLEQKMDTAAWSAGQRQLLCLARAMIKKHKVLLLDEAASNVDSATEATMQGIIDTEFKECTVLAIMHRLDHSERYDRVVVMEDGAVVEVGEPRTLATTDSRFARMLKSRTWLDSPSNQT